MDKDFNHLPSESHLIPSEAENAPMSDQDMNGASPSTDSNENRKDRTGITFNWFNLLIGGAVILGFRRSGDFFSGDFSTYLFLALAVVIHEMGHVVMGKAFGCMIREMQVFFLSFISYKPKRDAVGNSWRDITWSLGVLPLGGVTMFRSRKQVEVSNREGVETSRREMETGASSSPYIEDKPAWQRLLISAAGVLFNIATFFILYFTTPLMSDACYDGLWPLMSFSLVLALLNILPVYPLDGGAIVFAIYEIVTGKKPAAWFTTTCSWIGLIFIILFFWVFPEWLGEILDHVFRFLF